ncbi:coiled-coil and C2 domain-containing protein 2A isoform X2 [Daktulosphaira vitifoliae]|uniref:coiled-coil and C2 domain-containing protein 2A isoform X2 n=1 Tax=Daktulosphaira vitifoliae TaxID=58002 RepID=UPI0021AA05C5|nr:coiled-coil and C2 domain-containing protein 2A isoform X2 [Daktulosphaira vitifoliae]
MDENDLKVTDYWADATEPHEESNLVLDSVTSPTSLLGSRRPSLDGISSPCTSQSEIRSFKDRLREHVNQVKEKASNSVVEHTKSKTLHNIKQPADRFAQMISSENLAVQIALEKHEKDRQDQILELSDMYQKNHEEESYDFFTKVWDPPIIQEQQNQPNDSCEVEISYPNEENKKLVTTDFLGLSDGEEIEVLDHKILPSMDTSINIKKATKELLFIPNGSPVNITERLNNRQPHYPEKEGLYVYSYPPVHKKCLNKLQQRIIKAKEFHWFGEDGELIRLPDPLDNLSACYVPNIFNNNRFLDLSYTSAVPFLSPYTFNSNLNSKEVKFVLELEIEKIQFSHHALFSKQHVLDKRLMQLYKKYKHRQEMARTKILSGRLEALRNAKSTLLKVITEENNEELLEIHKNRLQRYKTEIKETRAQCMLEGKADRSLISNILATWRDLKKLRERQEYIITNTKLEIIVENCDNTDEWETEFNKQIEETIEELKDNNIEVNITKIRDEILNRLSESIRSPGDPLINFVVTNIEPLSNDKINAKDEIQRRNALAKCFLWFEIIFNSHVVCKSIKKPMNNDFCAEFNQKFVVEIHQWPESLSLNIHMDNTNLKTVFNKNPITELFIPFPINHVTLDIIETENLEFSCFGSQNVQNSGVGSGIDFKIFPEDSESLCLYTSGEVICKVGWGKFGDKILSPPENYFSELYSTKFNILPIKTEKILNWMNDIHPDPNDPNNASFYDAIKSLDDEMIRSINSKFRLNIYKHLLEFCSEEELESNPRLKLLKLRDRGEIEFRSIKAIPLKEWAIPKDIFSEFENRLSTSELALEVAGLGTIETSRIWSRYSIIRLYDKILKQCKLGNRNKITRDIIVEDSVPDIGTLGLTFMKMFQPKRPLRPRRKERKKIPVKCLSDQEIKVTVNVMRAFEVPIRKNSDIMIGDVAMVPVQPFIEITFKNYTSRTTTAEGSNPTWNQDLHLTVRSNSVDFYSNEVEIINDYIHINMYDEITVDILEDDRVRETNIHQRLERHWLGSCTLPISALLNNSQIEGTFQLNTPKHLLGYERHMSSTESSHYRNSTFLSLFIMAQPPLNSTELIKEKLDCNETPNFERYLEYWSTEGVKLYSKRPVKTLVIHCSGKTVCATRYFRPLPLPLLSEDYQTSSEMIARFVSLIPVIHSNILLMGHFDVWLTGDQLLGLLLGRSSGVDHGILLCCYFMKLDIKVWLILGTGITRGEAAYVLTLNTLPDHSTMYNIWDPLSGQKYSTSDSFSPLQEVNCLINDENIWLNIQIEKSVPRTNWDVRQKRDWYPAFGRFQAAPTIAGSVQPPTIDYTPAAISDARFLQEKLENILRNSLMKWRLKSKTVWNRYCISVLRKILPYLEKETWTKNNNVDTSYLDELQHLLVSHRICGFPINKLYSSTEQLIDAVKATGLHLNENEQVEFALAVYIHPYPNQVLSVWIYLASLQPRR